MAEAFPLHVVIAWLGNLESVATWHYLQVTDEHFASAAEKTVQNPVHSASDFTSSGVASGFMDDNEDARNAKKNGHM